MVGCVLSGRPSDDRPNCPPPITAERARQNVPSASSYMSLKHSQSRSVSGSAEQDTMDSLTHRGSLLSTQSASQAAGQHHHLATGQRVHNDETVTQGGQKKKVRHFLKNSPLVKIATSFT